MNHKTSNFKAGDVVKLPSEDKLMTVESVEGDKVFCVWLDPQLNAVYHDFSADVLVFPDPISGGPKDYVMEN